MRGETRYTGTHMDKPCDICGDVGYKELIVICSKCCTACEHVYCMRGCAREVPEAWVCEACLSSSGIVSPKSGGEEEFLDSHGLAHHDVKHPGTPGKAWQVRSKKLKVEAGKVKFLPTEEAIRLSSGTLKMGCRQHNNPGLKYGFPSSIAPMSSRTSVPCKIMTQKFSVLRDKENPNIVPPGFLKAPTPGGAEIYTSIGRHEVKPSKQSKEDCGRKQWPGTTYIPAKEDTIFKAKTKEVKIANANSENTMYRVSHAPAISVHCVPSKKLETSNRKIDKAMNNTSPLTVSPITSSGKTFDVVAEPGNFSVDERDLLNILSKLELYCQYLPALEDTWKGGFKFFDTATMGKFYGGFQARLPCRVHRKVFEFSKKLPLILQVKLLPRTHLWANLFGNDCPDFHDIALYIFPAANIERSKQNLSCLFELLEIQNLVMRSYIDGVELLIFTSKQLHIDCQRIIARSNTEYFFWGVFCHVKSYHILDTSQEVPSLVSTMECACNDHANTDNPEVIDMNIDMEGGRIVGPVDIVVSKELSGKAYGGPNKGDVNSATGKILEPKRGRCTSSELFSKSSEEIKCKTSSEDPLKNSEGKLVNTKDDSVFPPGFKKIPMLNSKRIEEKARVADGVKNHVKMENLGFQGVSRAAFGASSLQPRRSSKDSKLISQKHHQEPARDLAYNPLAPFAPPLSAKDNKTGLKTKAERIDNENPCKTSEKKDLEVEAVRKMNISVSCRPPPKNWVKLNIQASSSGALGSARAGGIVRDESGKWLLGYSKNLGTIKSLASEFWALYHGLELVWERGFRKVLVESVSEEALKCLEQPIAFLDPNRALIQCCRDLLHRNWDCKFQHVYREANSCADWLATHSDHQPLGSLAIFDSPPHKILPTFQKYSTGIVPSHSCQSPNGFRDQLQS